MLGKKAGRALAFFTVAALIGDGFLNTPKALAQGKNPYKAVSNKDADGDGKVSLEEWPKSKAIFRKIDKDKDGFLSPEDFAKHWGIPLPQRRAAASAGGKKKAKPGAGPGCPEQSVERADTPYVIEKNRPTCAFTGTTLFVDSAATPVIVEMDMSGNVVWRHDPGSGDTTRCNRVGNCETVNGPLVPMDVTRLANGNTLYGAKRNGLYEVNAAGKVVWKHMDGQASHDVDRLPNGNTLYARGWVGKGEDHLREVTPDGTIVWSWNGLKQYDRDPYGGVEDQGWIHVNAATRMPNGNTWISLRNFDIFVEVDRAGNVVREVKLPLPGTKISKKDRERTSSTFKLVAPHDPEVAANGNLLIPHAGVGGLLVETDPSGTKIIFQKRFRRGKQRIYHIRDANRLPNGNILITSASRLVEINARGRVVWQMKHSELAEKVKNDNQFFKAIRIAPDGTAYGG